MIKIDAFLGLESLLDFLLLQARSCGDEGGSEKLGPILGDMDTCIWINHEPENVLWAWTDATVWVHWNSALESLQKDEGLSKKRPIALLGQGIFKRDQVFVATFHFLKDHFWEQDHDISLYTVMHKIAGCIGDLKKNKPAILWTLWLQCLEAEQLADNEYSFDETLQKVR